LLSIVRPSGGEATILGHDIRSPLARQSVGYLPEGHRFPQYLTARGVCRYMGRLSGLHGAVLDREVAAKLDLVGMSDWLDTKVSKFSKGMAQRVGVAQALLGDPEVIFLDEPTDGVDPIGRAGLHYVIREATKQGTTVFINSHLLAELEGLCDEVGILNQGELVEQGSVSDVTAAVAGDRLVVRVRTGDVPPEVWTALEGRGAKAEPDDYFSIELDDEAAIPVLIDELRGAGVAIYAIMPKRMQLEEAFVQIIAARGGDGKVHA
jgi:ABC-2 type transport system ATP-binding protein